jgi:hypothetical protein
LNFSEARHDGGGFSAFVAAIAKVVYQKNDKTKGLEQPRLRPGPTHPTHRNNYSNVSSGGND